MKTIYITPTQARQDFFELVKKVTDQGITVVISGQKLSVPVVLSKQQVTTAKQRSKDQVDLESLAGSIRVKRVDLNETAKAHEVFARQSTS